MCNYSQKLQHFPLSHKLAEINYDTDNLNMTVNGLTWLTFTEHPTQLRRDMYFLLSYIFTSRDYALDHKTNLHKFQRTEITENFVGQRELNWKINDKLSGKSLPIWKLNNVLLNKTRDGGKEFCEGIKAILSWMTIKIQHLKNVWSAGKAEVRGQFVIGHANNNNKNNNNITIMNRFRINNPRFHFEELQQECQLTPRQAEGRE